MQMVVVSSWHLSPEKVACNIPMWLPEWTLFHGSTAWGLRAQILEPDGLASNPGSVTLGFRTLGMLYTSQCLSFLVAKCG